MLKQEYHLYTPTDHNTWSILYKRQVGAVAKYAYNQFMNGITQLEFPDGLIPDFNVVNKNLKPLTGWEIFAVPGLIDNKLFFEQMQQKQFAATTWIRKPSQIDYLEEPDMFHDVFGHVPLLADSFVADYLCKLADIATQYIENAEVVEAIARLYWYTIEFGLVKENGDLKIYGAGILSSIAETEYCYSNIPMLLPFDVEVIVNTPYIKDSFQKQYFVLDEIEQLSFAASALEKYLEQNYQPAAM